jgi:hypothetical protein
MRVQYFYLHYNSSCIMWDFGSTPFRCFFCDTRCHDLVPTCSTCHPSQPTIHQVSVSAATRSIVVLQVFRGLYRLIWYCFWRQQDGYSHPTVTHTTYICPYCHAALRIAQGKKWKQFWSVSMKTRCSVPLLVPTLR